MTANLVKAGMGVGCDFLGENDNLMGKETATAEMGSMNLSHFQYVAYNSCFPVNFFFSIFNLSFPKKPVYEA
jgi:hypothetical protein